MPSSLLSWIFSNFWNFSNCFGCFLPANTTNKKSLNYRDFTISFLCNIRSHETCSLRDQDSQKWVSRLVSRSRPSLETPSLSLTVVLTRNETWLPNITENTPLTLVAWCAPVLWSDENVLGFSQTSPKLDQKCEPTCHMVCRMVFLQNIWCLPKWFVF